MLNFCTIIILNIEYELYFNKNIKVNGDSFGFETLDSNSFILRIITSLLILANIYNNYKFHSLEFCISYLQHNIEPTTTFLKSAHFYSFVGSSVIYLIHNPIGFSHTITYSYKNLDYVINTNGLITVLAFSKVGLILISLLQLYKYSDKYGKSLQHDTVYISKKLLIDYPVRSILTLLAATFISLSVSIRVFERTHEVFFHTRPLQWTSLFTGFWITIVTASTVGYGDIYPVTHPGRLICILSGIFGVFVLSLMIVALANTMDQTKYESYVTQNIKMKKIVNLYYTDTLKHLIRFSLLVWICKFKIKKCNSIIESNDNFEHITKWEYDQVVEQKQSFKLKLQEYESRYAEYNRKSKEYRKVKESDQQIEQMYKNIMNYSPIHTGEFKTTVTLVNSYSNQLEQIEKGIEVKKSMILDFMKKIEDFGIENDFENYEHK